MKSPFPRPLIFHSSSSHLPLIFLSAQLSLFSFFFFFSFLFGIPNSTRFQSSHFILTPHISLDLIQNCEKSSLNDILTSSQAVSNMPVDQMLHLRIDCPINNVDMVITPPAESDVNLENKALEQPIVTGSLSRIYRFTP